MAGRLVLGAVLVTLWGGPAWSENGAVQPEADQVAQSQPAATGQSNGVASDGDVLSGGDVPTNEPQLEPIANEGVGSAEGSPPDRNDGRNYAEEDLLVQERMAVATEGLVAPTGRMADLSWWQVIVTGIGTALLLLTLGVTAWAAKAASRAAKAAENVVGVTAEIGERQLRAYVQAETGGAKFSDDEGHLIVKLRNVGQTPAYSLTTDVDAQMFQAPLPDNTQFHGSPRDNKSVETDLTLGAGMSTSIRFALPKAGLPIMKRLMATGVEAHFVIFGQTTYRDVYGKKRATRFCHVYTGPNFNADKGRYYETGNDAN